MTLIAHYEPGTFALLEVITSFRRLTQVFPAPHSWVNPVTNEHLVAQDVPARLVAETAQPAIDVFQSIGYTAERQPDTTWLQVWNAPVAMSLSDGRAFMRSYVRSYLDTRLEVITTAEAMAFQEVRTVDIEIALGGTPATSRYPIIAAIAADRSISITAARAVVAGYLDAYSSAAAATVPHFYTAIDDIQAAADIDDLRAVKAFIDGLP